LLVEGLIGAATYGVMHSEQEAAVDPLAAAGALVR
jgi:hypothetical protein